MRAQQTNQVETFTWLWNPIVPWFQDVQTQCVPSATKHAARQLHKIRSNYIWNLLHDNHTRRMTHNVIQTENTQLTHFTTIALTVSLTGIWLAWWPKGEQVHRWHGVHISFAHVSVDGLRSQMLQNSLACWISVASEHMYTCNSSRRRAQNAVSSPVKSEPMRIGLTILSQILPAKLMNSKRNHYKTTRAQTQALKEIKLSFWSYWLTAVQLLTDCGASIIVGCRSSVMVAGHCLRKCFFQSNSWCMCFSTTCSKVECVQVFFSLSGCSWSWSIVTISQWNSAISSCRCNCPYTIAQRLGIPPWHHSFNEWGSKQQISSAPFVGGNNAPGFRWVRGQRVHRCIVIQTDTGRIRLRIIMDRALRWVALWHCHLPTEPSSHMWAAILTSGCVLNKCAVSFVITFRISLGVIISLAVIISLGAFATFTSCG